MCRELETELSCSPKKNDLVMIHSGLWPTIVHVRVHSIGQCSHMILPHAPPQGNSGSEVDWCCAFADSTAATGGIIKAGVGK